MSINKPFKRIARPFTEERIKEGGLWKYIYHPEFANSPEHYVRAYLILLKDFETYSFRIHELFVRVCIEIEANCVAILSENGYAKAGNWTMADYKKINKSHKLSSYKVRYPVWKGDKSIRTPFEKWDDEDTKLPWWDGYNKSKHDRHGGFEMATFQNLTDAICGLMVVLSAQFEDNAFSPQDWGLSIGGINDGMKSSIGGYFRIKYPTDWLEEEKYDFNFSALEKDDPNPIDKYPYN